MMIESGDYIQSLLIVEETRMKWTKRTNEEIYKYLFCFWQAHYVNPCPCAAVPPPFHSIPGAGSIKTFVSIR